MKKSTRKILAMVLALAFACTLFGGINVFAADKSLDADISSDVSGIVQGDEVTITASASNFANISDGIIGFITKITYDSSVFTYVAESEILEQEKVGTLSVNDVEGTLYVVYLDDYPLDVPNPLVAGDLFSVNFEAKAEATSGTYDFTLLAGTDTGDDFADTDSSPSDMIAVTYGSPLAISVSQFGNSKSLLAGITSDVSEVVQGSDVTITASADGFANIDGGIIAFVTKITYDSSNFTFVADSETLLQAKDGTLSVNDVEGTLYVVYLDDFPDVVPNPLEAGNLFSVSFTANVDATLDAYDFTLAAGTTTGDDFADETSSISDKISVVYGSASSVSIISLEPITSFGTLKTRAVDPILTTKNLFNIEQGTSVQDVIDQLTLNTNVTLVITNMYDTLIDEADYATTVIGSGTIIEVKVSDIAVDSYTVIVYGDLDGDGYCGPTDGGIFWNYMCGVSTLTGSVAAAADIYMEGVPSNGGFGAIWNFVCLASGAVINQDTTIYLP